MEIECSALPHRLLGDVVSTAVHFLMRKTDVKRFVQGHLISMFQVFLFRIFRI